MFKYNVSIICFNFVFNIFSIIIYKIKHIHLINRSYLCGFSIFMLQEMIMMYNIQCISMSGGLKCFMVII